MRKKVKKEHAACDGGGKNKEHFGARFHDGKEVGERLGLCQSGLEPDEENCQTGALCSNGEQSKAVTQVKADAREVRR